MEVLVARSKSFRLHKELGRGGFGVVYLAQDLNTDPKFRRPLALKVLKERELNFVHNDYLLQVSALDLPNIAKFYRLEWLGDEPAQVFEYIEGPDLLTYLSKNGLSLQEFKTLFLQILKTLDALNQRALVHGDLSLENIIIHPKRGSVLIDFDPRPSNSKGEQKYHGIRADLESLKNILLKIPEVFPDLDMEIQVFAYQLHGQIEQYDIQELFAKYRDWQVSENLRFIYEYQAEKRIDKRNGVLTSCRKTYSVSLGLCLLIIASVFILFTPI